MSDFGSESMVKMKAVNNRHGMSMNGREESSNPSNVERPASNVPKPLGPDETHMTIPFTGLRKPDPILNRIPGRLRVTVAVVRAVRSTFDVRRLTFDV